MEGFIYILSDETYYNELRDKNVYKYVPSFLIKKMDSKLSGNIITEFKIGDNVIGYGVGVTTKEDLTEEELIGRIKNIVSEKLPIEKLSCIIFEKNPNLSLMRKLIDEEIIVSTDHSKEIKIKTIPLVIKQISGKIYKYNEDIELLIIPKEEEDIDLLLNKIPSDIKFISIYTNEKELGDKIRNRMMVDTGLSLEVLTDISKVNRFDIIINFKDDIKFRKWVKQKGIIFNIYNNIYSNIKCGVSIDDFIYNNREIIKSTNSTISLRNEIPSILYSYNNTFDINDFIGLKIGKNIYTIKEFCNKYTIKKQRYTS